MKIHQRCEAPPIDLAVFKRRHQRDHRTAKHKTSPLTEKPLGSYLPIRRAKSTLNLLSNPATDSPNAVMKLRCRLLSFPKSRKYSTTAGSPFCPIRKSTAINACP